jgi:MFS-type transporter involved in bile tolerance (Atg22 family)
MPENHQADEPPGVAALVGGILEDAQRLVRQEVALAQREVAHAWDKAKLGVAFLASALVVCSVVAVLLGFMLVRLLHAYLLPNHEWACFAIAAGLFAILAAVLVRTGLQQINQVHLSLPQTTETLRADARAVGDAVSGRPSAAALSRR